MRRTASVAGLSVLLVVAVALCLNTSAALGELRTVLTNGRIWTGDAKRPWAEAVAILNGQVIAVGSNQEALRAAGPVVERVDLAGAFAMPGFNDAHIHFISGSERLFQVDLNRARSLEEMQQRVAKFAKENPVQGDDPWIRGFGWQYSFMPNKRLPTRQDLDAVVSDRPVLLSAYDGHTSWANTKALELAKLTKDAQFSGFGEIVRDAQGQPTGVFKEGAMGLVGRAVPPSSRERKLKALRRGVKLAASLGITSIQNAHGSPEDVALYQELLDKGELTVRVSVAQTIRPSVTQQQIDAIAALAKKYNGPMLRVGSVKIVVDGVIETHTAAMLEPYSNNPSSVGTPAWTQEQLNEGVLMADKAGLQVYIHAIGDRGVRMALDAYENARKVNGPRDHRHRVEHIETVAAADIPRFKQLNVMASMMPIHADPETIDVWAAGVGKARQPRSFAWNTLEQAGAHLVYSSDWPAAISNNPIRGVHCAVNRTATDGKPAGGWIPEQRISLESTLRAYTNAGAFSSFEDKSKGKLSPGMAADIVVLSRDPFKTPPAELHTLRVTRTIVGGRKVHP